MAASLADYEIVIGLEVHAQLRTRSKLFSPAPVAFGADPNHSVEPVCLALPGVLPVLNRHAVECAILAGLATHCTVHTRSVFARKNYFYPDLPKGYQISQYEHPIATDGWIDIAVRGENGEASSKRIRLTRIHMEEDAGKSIHDTAVAGSDATLVDLNRAGVPLVEIVSEPDLRSPVEAGSYLRTLRSILRYIQVSDGDMEKGNFRCDANVSLRVRGQEEFGTRTELKNLNSFRFVEAAIAAEARRQAQVLADGGAVQQATMAYDADSDRTRVLRLKEDAHDYRYFPDPDLIPLVVSSEQIETLRAELPELADEKCRRFQEQHGLSEHDARVLSASRSMGEFFEAAVAAHGTAKAVANWLTRDVLAALGELEIEIGDAKLTPTALAALIRLVDGGRTTAKSAQQLIPELVREGGDPEAMVRERGLEAVSDIGVLGKAVDAVLAEHPDNVARYRAGEEKVLNFLMGQVMRRTQGKANPGAVREMLIERLK
ncbi:MAG: Asp-tRNA(Asn)/Glu-tRNA(Gln) amidotransferase subunit GatB [Myxococcota bacterium]